MVVPLVDICLQTVQEAIENGKIQRLHLLPPTLRQRVLDTVLLRGDISNPNCLDALSSVEFLDGMTSVNTQAAAEEKSWRDESNILPNQYVSDINDSKYLDRLAESLGKETSNGETLGASISKLSLNMYLFQDDSPYQRLDAIVNFDSVVRLIAQCTKLNSLDLHFVRYRLTSTNQPANIGMSGRATIDGGVLNKTKRMEPCRAVLEGLTELSIVSSPYLDKDLVLIDKPILDFKNLEKLRLSNCNLDPKAWKKLLMITKETLTELEAILVGCFLSGRGEFALLPCILPKLTIFKAIKFGVNRDFVSNLVQCPKLEDVFLEFDIGPDHPELSSLNGISANVGIKATAALVDKGDESFDSDDDNSENHYEAHEDEYFGRKKPSRLAAVEIFGSKTKKIDLVTEHWSKRLTEAVTHVVEVCPNLTSLEIKADDVADSKELREANMALAPIFSNPERAIKLTKLRLSGDFSGNVLESIFENCINLRKFSIRYCETVTNAHLITWANNGGWLITLEIKGCRNVGDDGLIPLINNSGSRMMTFIVDRPSRITDHTWRILIDRCRYLKKANIPAKFKDLQREKGFMKKLDFNWR